MAQRLSKRRTALRVRSTSRVNSVRIRRSMVIIPSVVCSFAAVGGAFIDILSQKSIFVVYPG